MSSGILRGQIQAALIGAQLQYLALQALYVPAALDHQTGLHGKQFQRLEGRPVGAATVPRHIQAHHAQRHPFGVVQRHQQQITVLPATGLVLIQQRQDVDKMHVGRDDGFMIGRNIVRRADLEFRQEELRHTPPGLGALARIFPQATGQPGGGNPAQRVGLGVIHTDQYHLERGGVGDGACDKRERLFERLVGADHLRDLEQLPQRIHLTAQQHRPPRLILVLYGIAQGHRRLRGQRLGNFNRGMIETMRGKCMQHQQPGRALLIDDRQNEHRLHALMRRPDALLINIGNVIRLDAFEDRQFLF